MGFPPPNNLAFLMYKNHQEASISLLLFHTITDIWTISWHVLKPFFFLEIEESCTFTKCNDKFPFKPLYESNAIYNVMQTIDHFLFFTCKCFLNRKLHQCLMWLLYQNESTLMHSFKFYQKQSTSLQTHSCKHGLQITKLYKDVTPEVL